MSDKWSRDDLPAMSNLATLDANPESYVYFALSVALDAVVAHLNREHPKTNIAPSGMSVNAALSDIAREEVARAWHAGSDHAADGAPFGGPLCNCWQVAGRIMPMLASAWDRGHYAGEWDHASALTGTPHRLLPNPYEGDPNVDQ